jgi:hypothetical protein
VGIVFDPEPLVRKPLLDQERPQFLRRVGALAIDPDPDVDRRPRAARDTGRSSSRRCRSRSASTCSPA